MLKLSLRRFLLRRLLRQALPFIVPRPRILDLGAGTAVDLQELRRILPPPGDRQSVLVDGQRAMIRQAGGSALPPTTRAVVADVARLPIRSGVADVVLSIGLLCCVDDSAIGSAILESTRALAPGGILVLAVPRWRGRGDFEATRASGLELVARGRIGRGVFRKPL